MGWFTSSHPVRLRLGTTDFTGLRRGGNAAGRAVKRIKEQLRAVPGDGLGYGMLRYLNPDTAPQLAALPTAQIGFNYLGRFAASKPADEAGPETAGAQGPSKEAGGPPADRLKDWQSAGEGGADTDTQVPVMHALEIMAVVHDLPEGPQLSLSVFWPQELLTEPSVQILIDSWVAMLTGLVAHTSGSGGGGHTPSDFPLVEVSQDELDEFEAAAKYIEEGE
ncbi:hypothetical protein FFZ77_20735 [Streptomyces katsurahamanus]|uniref:Condensation domain-containing protein n=1 Tax=Streptomyces katsurahamanus TaxID=2577098 RepID=A0ABW9NXA9_9ACTN|nr:hypothetical protein [Streptomyces katsurahamanus]